MKLKIFCYGCNEEINALDRCPLCGTIGDIGFEEDRAWHCLARLWAGSGYWGEKEILSLPLWFERNPEQLTEWMSFKARLVDVEAIPLPEHLKGRYAESYEYWVNASGILPLTHATLSDLITQRPIGPLVHKLATAYADHHRQLWGEEDRLKQEEQEKLQSEKKTRLIRRIRGGRRKRKPRSAMAT